jgi:hypothetical protein
VTLAWRLHDRCKPPLMPTFNSEMATGVKQHTDFQAPMNNLMPMMSSFNPSFRLPETYGFQGNQPPPPGSSTSSQSMNLQAISPNLLRSDQELSTACHRFVVTLQFTFTLLMELSDGASRFATSKCLWRRRRAVRFRQRAKQCQGCKEEADQVGRRPRAGFGGRGHDVGELG